MFNDQFYELSREKIICIKSAEETEVGYINAIITVSHFGRITTKPYIFIAQEWDKVKERGYIE